MHLCIYRQNGGLGLGDLPALVVASAAELRVVIQGQGPLHNAKCNYVVRSLNRSR